MKTVPEGAKQLGMSAVATWRLIYAGRLQYVKIGKSVRLRDEDLQAFINANVRIHKSPAPAKASRRTVR